MEMSTDESDATVKRICELVSAARGAGRAVTPDQQMIYDVDYLMLEAGSGASFEQYFRWASLEEIGRILTALRTVGLDHVAEITERAIRVAFPGGIPTNIEEDEPDPTDWSDDQARELRVLFSELEKQYGHVTNTLAAFAARVGVTENN